MNKTTCERKNEYDRFVDDAINREKKEAFMAIEIIREKLGRAVRGSEIVIKEKNNITRIKK